MESNVSNISALARTALSSMLDSRFFVEAAQPKVQNGQLYPDEQAYIIKAAQKRQAEFGTARVCARKALTGLGAAPCSLLPNADRSPRWPTGFLGSISHTDDCCAVAVTKSRGVAGLGIDIEPETPLAPELEEQICTANERSWLSLHSTSDRTRLGTLLFSAKEAVYKCQYTVTGSFLDFKDVELEVDIGRCTFSVADLHLNKGLWRETIMRLQGQFRQMPCLIVTASILEIEE